MPTKISSFNQVELTKDSPPLILCDIDETILYFPECDTICKKFIQNNWSNNTNILNYKPELNMLKNMYMQINKPSHTDYDGFVNMLKKIREKRGKLLFLTARHWDSDKWTKKQLNQIGVYSEDLDIHYTGALITKGEYIKRYIDLSEWDNIIFIDDYDSYIKSVMDLHPQIVCYKIEATYNT